MVPITARAAAVAAALLLPAIAAADEARTVSVENVGAKTVERLFVSPTSDTVWGEDRLGDAMLPPGRSVPLRLPAGMCAFDLRVIFADQTEFQRRGLDLCASTDLRLP